MLALILAIIPFVAVSGVLLHFSQGLDLSSYETTLIGVNFTLAIFAVNFAFLGYQSSTFRELRKGIAVNVITASLFVILIAALPLALLVFNKPHVSRVSLALIPIVAYCGVGLLALAQHETDPIVLLKRFCSERKTYRFFYRFTKDAYVRYLSIKDLELSKPGEMPSHEFEWHIPPDGSLTDPLDILFSVTVTAVRSSNLYVFERGIYLALKRVDNAATFTPPIPEGDRYKIKAVVQRQADNLVSRIVSEIIENDRSGTFTRKALDVLSLHILNKAAISQQTSDTAWLALSLMTKLGEHSLKCGQYQDALIPVIVARQITQKGLHGPLGPIESGDKKTALVLFDHSLSDIPNVIRRLGSFAVTQKNSDYVYRCLDALGWLGCSAVKANRILVGRSCLRGLSQLGRECRANELECFWDRCALQPSDHANERIGWIATWVPQVDDSAKDGWLNLIGEALSRLGGTTVSLTITVENEKPIIKYHNSGTPHKLSYTSEGLSRTIDYSNIHELKDFTLH